MAVPTKLLFALALFVIPLSFAHADSSVSFSPAVVHPSTATWALTESGYDTPYLITIFDSTGHYVEQAANNTANNVNQAGTIGCWIQGNCGAAYYNLPNFPSPTGMMTVVVFDTTVSGYDDRWCNRTGSRLSDCIASPAFVAQTTFDFEPDPPGVFLSFTPTINPDGSLFATAPGTAVASTDSSGVTVTVTIPSGATITALAGSGWDGIVNLPQVSIIFTQPTDPGFTDSVVSAIEVGATDTPLTFDKGVHILFAGQAGTLVGWSQGGVFTPVTALCFADTQEAGDALANGGDCKIDSGADLAVWTKHFSTFVIYTQIANPPPPVPAPVNGSVGSGSGGNFIPVTVATTPSVGQVLGAAAYNFSKNLWYGMHDPDVAELQKFLVAENYSIPHAVTNYFGSETLAAVKAFQAANSIPSTGFVGPITRGLLNKGVIGPQG